jgi:hypothetical protein
LEVGESGHFGMDLKGMRGFKLGGKCACMQVICHRLMTSDDYFFVFGGAFCFLGWGLVSKVRNW